MYEWKELIKVYSKWRWGVYEKAKKHEVFIRTLRRKGSIKLSCKQLETRLDFSSYAGLSEIISVNDMKKLEDNFLKNR